MRTDELISHARGARKRHPLTWVADMLMVFGIVGAGVGLIAAFFVAAESTPAALSIVVQTVVAGIATLVSIAVIRTLIRIEDKINCFFPNGTED